MSQNLAYSKKNYSNNRSHSRNGNHGTGSPTVNKEVNTVVSVGSIDHTIFVVVIILVLFGIVMVSSSSYAITGSSEAYKYDMFFYLKRNALLAAVGFASMMFMVNFNYKYLKRLAFPLYMATNVLLVVVLFIGIQSHGRQRWIEIPVFGQFQPSEVAKGGLILFLSLIISSGKDLLKKWSGFIFCCGLVGVTAALVLVANLSTAIIITLTGIGLIFIASPHVTRFLVMGGSGAAVLVSYLAFFADNFQSKRFDAWLRPFDDPINTGYQVLQSLYAIASGGLFGLGLGQSRQKTFVPEAHNDIIFAIICEELGFFGAFVVLMLFGVFIWRGIRIAANAPDTYSSLVAAGIVILIACQVVINVAVVTNTIPNTGVPLPFISYGGTSLLVMMTLTGILLNISRCSKD